MDTILAGLNYEIVYLDGILINSENTKRHRKHVREVFKRINEYCLKQGPEKCDYFMVRIKYLGQVIDKKGRKPDPESTKAIKNMPLPENITKLQAFQGLSSYNSVYIAKRYELRSPFEKTTKEGEKGCWNKEYEKAFQEIF